MSSQNPNPEELRRMVNDTIDKVFATNGKTLSPEQQAIQRAVEVCNKVTRDNIPHIRAACMAKRFNPLATQKLIMASYLDGFRTWPKDDLLFLLVVMHTEAAMQKIVEAERAGLYDI